MLLQSVVLLFVITSMQAIYNYTPEANHVSVVHNVADILWV